MAKNELSPMAKSLWALAITQGVLAILFGTLALFWPGLTVALLIILFSVFILVWGVVGLIVSLSSIGSNKFWWLELIFSVLAIGLSVYMLRNPEATAGIFVFFIGLTFLVRGVVDILEGMFDKDQPSNNRWLHAIVGVLGVIAGIITLTHPVTAGVAIVWVIGLYAVLYGALVIAFAFREQNALKK